MVLHALDDAARLGWKVVVVRHGRPPRGGPWDDPCSSWSELGPDELLLDERECSVFLEGLPGSGAGETGPTRLLRLTGGWLAGLHLVRSHLLAARDPDAALDDLALHPPRSVRRLAAVLLEELPAPVRAFLAATAGLGELDPDLCDAALARTDSVGILEALDASDTSLVDRRGPWPRLLPLFERAVGTPDRSVLGRAARWCLERGFHERALELALDASDGEVVEVLAERAVRGLLAGSEFGELRRQADRIPPELADARPFVSLFVAWARFHSGREKEGARHLTRARSLALSAPDSGVSRVVEHSEFLRAVSLRMEGRLDDSVRCAAAAAARSGDGFLRASLVVQEGLGRFRAGQTVRSRQVLSQALDLAEESGHHIGFYGACYTLCEIELLRGRPASAEEILRRAEEYRASDAERAGPVSGYLHVARGRVHLWRGDLPRARAEAELGLELGRRCDNVRTLQYGHHLRALVELLEGDSAAALGSARLSREVSRRTRMHWGMDADAPDALEAALQGLVEGDAPGWLEIHLPQAFRGPRAWALARAAWPLLLKRGRAAEALMLSRHWTRALENDGLLGAAAEAWAWRAAAEERTGRGEGATRSAERALELSEARGQRLPTLLLRAFGAGAETVRAVEAVPAAVEGEGLSAREIEVLRALGSGLSNKDIGRTLFVAESTVKSHVKSIFAKLGVANRTQAVLRADDLGLIARTA